MTLSEELIGYCWMVLTWTFSQQTRALFKRWSQVCTILSARGRAGIGARSMSRCHTRTTGSTASGPLGKIWVTSIDCKKVTRSSLINTKRNFKVWMHQGTGRFKISLNQISPSVHVCLLKQVTAIKKIQTILNLGDLFSSDNMLS